MSLIQKIQQGDYYEVNILELFICIVPADRNGAVFGIVSGVLDSLGFEDRMMQMGENPLYEKSGDGKFILATLTLCKPNGQPFTTQEFQQRGRTDQGHIERGLHPRRK